MPGGTAFLSMMVKTLHSSRSRRVRLYANCRCSSRALPCGDCEGPPLGARNPHLRPKGVADRSSESFDLGNGCEGIVAEKVNGVGGLGRWGDRQTEAGREEGSSGERAQRERQREQWERRLRHHSAHKRACLPGEGEEGAKAVDEGATGGVDGEVERKGNSSSTKRTFCEWKVRLVKGLWRQYALLPVS